MRPQSPVCRRLPMTSGQRRVFLQCQIQGGDVAYHLTDVVRIRGPFSLPRLKKILNIFIQRHETLRTGFRTVEGEFIAEIHDHAEPSFIEIQGTEAEINHLIKANDKPYDLSAPSLMQVLAIHLGKDDLVLATTCHHMIFDGYSAAVLGRENYLLSIGRDLPPLKHQYSDFVRWQEDFFQSPQYQKQKTFWLSQFQTPPKPLDFPTDFPRPLTRDLSGKSFVRTLPSDRLKTFCQGQGGTLYMALLAAYYALWNRITGQEDITIGTVTSARESGGFQEIIGMLANTLALRQYPRAEIRFSEFLKEVKSLSIQGLSHADYPFEHLARDLPFTPSNPGNPLFDLVFTYEKKSRRRPAAGMDTIVQPLDYIVSSSMFPITIEAFDCETHVELVVEYATDLYREETLHAILDAYIHILDQVCSTPGIPIGELRPAGPDALARLEGFNNTASRLRKGRTFIHLWENQVRLSPDNPAVVCGDDEISYQQLDEMASNLAHALGQKDLSEHAVIGVAMERSHKWVACILGIWKTDKVYLPLDTDQPDGRTAFFLEDSRCELVITTANRMGKIPSQYPVIDLDKLPEDNGVQAEYSVQTRAESPAYIIYTSGSTGRPKGVKTGHSALFTHIAGLKKTYRIQPDDNLLQFSSQIFDASLEQVLITLGYGARLVIPPNGAPPAPQAFTDLMAAQQITVAELPPAYLSELGKTCPSGGMPSLRLLISGGEALPPAVAESLLNIIDPETRLMNFYGPTEAVMAAAVYEVPHTPSEKTDATRNLESIPIGRPLPNTCIHILSPDNQILPPGLPGELCIAGNRLAHGYLNNPELTVKAFPEIRIRTEKERIYRTGDLARWLPDGNLEFLGRKDNQIQLRGYRIEPGEIENVLLSHPLVQGAAVALKQEGGAHLAAFVSLREDAPPDISFTEYLSSRLPGYMVPSAIIILDEFPMTQAGKIDRKAIENISVGRQISSPPSLPQDPVEYTLILLWQKIFKTEGVSPDHNFLELGGHSLGFIRLVADIHDIFGITIPVARLMRSMTIRSLARFIRDQEEGPSHATLIPLNSGNSSTALFLIPGTDNQILCFHRLISSLEKSHDCYALQFPEDESHTAVNPLGEFHCREILEAAKDKKIILAGYSFGGYVAYEIGRLLAKQGHDRTELIIIDVPAPLNRNLKAKFTLSREMILDHLVTALTGSPVSKNLDNRALEKHGAAPADEASIFTMLREGNHIPASLTLDQFSRMIRLSRLRLEEFYNYFPGTSLPLPLHIVRATKDLYSQKFFNEDGDWPQMCKKPVTLTRIDGDHFSILNLPGVTQLARFINRICDGSPHKTP